MQNKLLSAGAARARSDVFNDQTAVCIFHLPTALDLDLDLDLLARTSCTRTARELQSARDQQCRLQSLRAAEREGQQSG